MLSPKRTALIVASTAALALANSAHAADWTDFIYAGYGTGYQYSQLNAHIPAYSYNTKGDFDSEFKPTSSAWLNNLFFGVGNQATNGWYWGIELNANYANNTGFDEQDDHYADNFDNYVAHRVNISLDWSVDVDALFGHTLDEQNKWLGYVKVGPSIAEVKATYKAYDQQSEAGMSYGNLRTDKTSKDIYGALIGLGLRYQLDPHWVAGLEGDFTYYPTQTVKSDSDFSDGTGVHSTSMKYGFKPLVYAIKATIAYRF